VTPSRASGGRVPVDAEERGRILQRLPRRTQVVSDPVRRALKRLLDIVGSLLALAVLSPLFILVALAVSLDSEGPVIFRQVRVGHDRRRRSGAPPGGRERRIRDAYGFLFPLYKFRSMHVNAPRYSVKPGANDDPRITRVGRFLRRTSLDEIPQFINVLRGDMSLVGPRPEMPFIVAEYDAVHRRRLAVKQGLTGMWQLWGPRHRPIHEAIEWDLDYVENWSIALDLVILRETLFFAVRGLNH
jgi:lipopolysaccharide/colanic/teichoic acid biosynthesis glycosyltransferase